MSDNRNVAVNDFEAIMRPKARLSKCMVGRMLSMEILTAGRKPDGHGVYKCYPE
jgi:hypothetical protein